MRHHTYHIPVTVDAGHFSIPRGDAEMLHLVPAGLLVDDDYEVEFEDATFTFYVEVTVPMGRTSMETKFHAAQAAEKLVREAMPRVVIINASDYRALFAGATEVADDMVVQP